MSPLPREWTRRICPEMPPLLLLVPVLWFLPLSGAAPSPAAEQLDTGVVSFLTFSTWVGGGGMKFCCLLPLLDMGGKFFPLDTTTGHAGVWYVLPYPYLRKSSFTLLLDVGGKCYPCAYLI